MTQVSMNKALAENLINTKLGLLQEEIDQILAKWGYTDAAAFLKDTEQGIIKEAENDAIGLTNLIDQRENLFQTKKQWNDQEGNC
ncbi:MAG TPA: hypothetical protein VKM55_07435 [Candidatus Lokiarchaeia archaeon]|nr:hypothetical protein [Candidatus Lokiarchaeia archaeon]